jgi:hypothetical protein
MRTASELLTVLRVKTATEVLVWRQMAIGTGSTPESASRNADQAGKMLVAASLAGVSMAISPDELAMLLGAGARDLGRQIPGYHPSRGRFAYDSGAVAFDADGFYDDDDPEDDPDNPYGEKDSFLWEGSSTVDDFDEEDSSRDEGELGKLRRNDNAELLYSLFPNIDAPQSTTNIRLIADEATRIFHRVLAERSLENLTPRQLEQLLAECFRREGYETYLTPQTRDGGCDVIAVRPGEFPYLVVAEAKKKRLVEPALVFSLKGVRDHHRAHMAVLATTGRFSERTRGIVRNDWGRLMDLRDGEQFMDWIRRIRDKGGK